MDIRKERILLGGGAFDSIEIIARTTHEKSWIRKRC